MIAWEQLSSSEKRPSSDPGFLGNACSEKLSLKEQN